jgi:hypothetical protein
LADVKTSAFQVRAALENIIYNPEMKYHIPKMYFLD